MFRCKFCAFRHHNSRLFLDHNRCHETLTNFFIKCWSCPASFTQVRYLKRHAKTHAHFPQSICLHQLQEVEEANPVLHVAESAAGSSQANSPDQRELGPTPLKSDSRFSVASFLLKLKSDHAVADSTCAFIAKEMKTFLEKAGEDVQEGLSVSCPEGAMGIKTTPTYAAFSEFSSVFKLNTFIKAEMCCTLPTRVMLEAHVGGKPGYIQHVSIAEQLQNLVYRGLLSPDMLTARNPRKDIYDDIYAGSKLRPSPDGGQCKNIDVILYFDDFQPGNPLGPVAQNTKLGAIYFTLGNLTKFARSKTEHIFLASLFRSAHVKRFGINAVLRPIVNELKGLETCGIYFPTLGERVPVRTIFFVADNLAAHTVAMMSENFYSSKHGCRFCLMSCEDMRNVFFILNKESRAVPFVTQEKYEQELKKLDDGLLSAYKGKSILTELKDFKIYHDLPSDVAHDVLEGVIPYALSEILTSLVKNHNVRLDTMNKRIEEFNYSYIDLKDKPLGLTIVKGVVRIKQKAWQNRTMMRLLPLLIGDVVPDCPEWRLLIRLSVIVEYVLAPVLDEADINVLQEYIWSWLKAWSVSFPDFRWKPKFHFMFHYAAQIRRLGPMRYTWALRFESKHQVLKRLSRGSMNRVNLSKTYAKKHQYHMTEQLNKPNYLRSSTKVVRQKGDKIAEMLIEGNLYRPRDVILWRRSSNRVQFCLIEQLTSEGDVSVQLLNGDGYNAHCNAYVVRKTGIRTRLIHVDFADPFALSLYDENKIVLHHFVDGIY